MCNSTGYMYMQKQQHAVYNPLLAQGPIISVSYRFLAVITGAASMGIQNSGKRKLIQVAIVGRVLNAWFNDCAVDKSGQNTNPIIANACRPRTI